MAAANTTAPALITVKEAGYRLGIKNQAVLLLMHRGRLRGREMTPPGTHPARRIYQIEEASVAELLHDFALQSRENNQRYKRDPARTAEMRAKGYVTVSEAAKMLGMDVSNVARYCAKGTLPSLQLHIRFIRKEDVITLQNHRIAALIGDLSTR